MKRNRSIKKQNVVATITKGVFYFVLICISFIYLEPILRIITKTFMQAGDIIDPAVEWVPRKISFDNLKIAAKALNLSTTLRNSILFSTILAMAQTLVSALTGFALSRFDFKFKRFWFVMILICFIIPLPVLMIPRLMMFISAQEAIGITLIGTPLPQVLMALFGQGVYSTILILIFYNFFNLIPHSLDEAAMIDGASSLQVFYHVAIRLSTSTLLVVFLFSFVWNWNETYVTGTLVRSSIELLPMKLNIFDSALESLASSQGNAFRLNEAYKMAATLISITPLLILYAFVQKRFIQGIENTGITGE